MPRNCKCGGRYRNESSDAYQSKFKVVLFRCDKCGKRAHQRLRRADK